MFDVVICTGCRHARGKVSMQAPRRLNCQVQKRYSNRPSCSVNRMALQTGSPTGCHTLVNMLWRLITFKFGVCW